MYKKRNVKSHFNQSNLRGYAYLGSGKLRDFQEFFLPF